MKVPTRRRESVGRKEAPAKSKQQSGLERNMLFVKCECGQSQQKFFIHFFRRMKTKERQKKYCKRSILNYWHGSTNVD